MQLTPRYGPDPIVVIDDIEGIVEATVRQRERLAVALEGLDDAGWAHPSRCEGWSMRDVMVHLESTNGFWSWSIQAGLAGDPTRFLATFDPVASPADLVAGSSATAAEVLVAFRASNAALADLLGSLDAEQLAVQAEAPPGHQSVAAVAHHALWDSWVHERDILLPLGIEPEVEDDEVAACLRYAAALGPALGVGRGDASGGSLTVRAADPDVAFTVSATDHVQIGAVDPSVDRVLEGDAVDLVEAISLRQPFAPADAEAAAWLVGGLEVAFDVAD